MIMSQLGALVANTRPIQRIPDLLSATDQTWYAMKHSEANLACQPNQDTPSIQANTEIDNQAVTIINDGSRVLAHLFNQMNESEKINLTLVHRWSEALVEFMRVDHNELHRIVVLRNKESYLIRHSISVATLLVIFAKHLGLDVKTLKELATGGLIHDVGKTKVDDSILNKPGKLSGSEFEVIKGHQIHAIDIIDHVSDIGQISKDVCLMHHEKLDGSGYPKGLTAESINLYGRMISIVDIYDALVSERVYKEGMSTQEAFKVLTELSGDKLDPYLVHQFINCIGIYPPGTVIELTDGRAGIGWRQNKSNPNNPTIKCFYDLKEGRYTEVKEIDLSRYHHLKIKRTLSQKSMPIDCTAFY